LGGRGRKNHKFEVRLGYIVRCLNTQKTQTKKVKEMGSRAVVSTRVEEEEMGRNT
jgi:hypothetical protein